MLRKICNALLESSLNHILTIKHLRITVVGEYTYGLPRFRGITGHGKQPIRYRMLEYRFLYSIKIYSLGQYISKYYFKGYLRCCNHYVKMIDLNYDQVSSDFSRHHKKDPIFP